MPDVASNTPPAEAQPVQPRHDHEESARAVTESSARVHTVAAGETLAGIAQHYYGKAGLHFRLFEANRDQLSDPAVVHEGMILKVP